MVLVIAVLAVAEASWAFYAAEAGVNLYLFYAVLVVASAIFWVPGVAEKRGA